MNLWVPWSGWVCCARGSTGLDLAKRALRARGVGNVGVGMVRCAGGGRLD